MVAVPPKSQVAPLALVRCQWLLKAKEACASMVFGRKHRPDGRIESQSTPEPQA